MPATIRLPLYLFLLCLVPACEESTSSASSKASRPQLDPARTAGKAAEALTYCQQQGLNTRYAILVDMSLHSGVNRMALWDFREGRIAYSCLVSHGCCSNPWSADYSKNNPVFSNVNGSHCSSLGKYKIGERGYSNWGVHTKYLLHGLEAGNKNALARQIVFHSWSAISAAEVYPDGTPEGWGCPAISDTDFLALDPILKTAERPVLMWLYN